MHGIMLHPIWKAIAAKVDASTGLPIERFEPGNPVTEGEPCTTYIGPCGFWPLREDGA